MKSTKKLFCPPTEWLTEKRMACKLCGYDVVNYYNNRFICRVCRQEYDTIFEGTGNEVPGGKALAVGIKMVRPE